MHIYKNIYTFAVQFWKIYTIRIIPLCKHSEWHAGVALFLYYPTRGVAFVRWAENISVAKNESKNALIQCSLLAYMHLLSTSDICVAFNNKVALTDNRVIVGATYVSALPKVNRWNLGLLLGAQRVMATRTSAVPHSKQTSLGLLWGPRFFRKQMKSWFTFGYSMP